jgi:hypothetical protein
MVDEIFDRTYQSGRSELNRALHGFFRLIGQTIGGSMAALHRAEFSAPWASSKKARRA